jgi:hypothetical protein
MKKLLPRLIIIILAAVSYWFLLATPLKACEGNEIDLLDYYIPKQANITNEIHHYDGSDQETGGLEYFYTYKSTVSNNKEGFYIVKSREAQYFEEFSYDNQYIYHLKDTTWATGPNQNVKCQDGSDAFYTVIDGASGANGYELLKGENEGGKITNRCMAVGDTAGPFPITILAFSGSTCEPCADKASTMQQTMTLLYQGEHTFPNGWHSNDLIILQSGTTGEKYYYDKQYGVVGFEGPGLKSFAVSQLKESREAEVSCDLSKTSIPLDDQTRVRAEWVDEITKKETHTERETPPATTNTSSNVLAAQTLSGFLGLSGRLIFQPEGAAPPQFPGVIQLTNYFNNAFKSLLPSARAKKAFLPSKKTAIKTTSYVQSKRTFLGIELPTQEYKCEDGPPQQAEDCAKHIIYAPSSWSKLVGSLTGIACEVLPTARATNEELCDAFRYKMPETDWKAAKYKHPFGPAGGLQNTPDPQHTKPEFHNVLAKLTETIEDIISNLLTKITDVYKAEYTVNVGGELPAGGYANQKSGETNSAFTTAQRYDDFGAKGIVQAIDSEMTTEAQFSPGNPETQAVAFANQLPTRNYACNTLCSAFTEKRVNEGMGWVGGDNICPSCDPKDYIVPDPPLPRPSDAPPWCQWDGFGCHFGCDVGKPLPDNPDVVCTLEMMQGCGPGKDPFCESGRCNPDEIGPKGDYAIPDPPCPVPYPTDEDQNCGQVCEWAVFNPSETGGYGTCHYQNAKVCVPTGSLGGQKSCANVCNAVCCLGHDDPTIPRN